MTKDELAELMEQIFDEIRTVRGEGQKEYAHNDGNAFANFDRLSERLGVSSEKVLLTYLYKHMDGIDAYVNGHESQREDVRGRIKDAMTYLAMLWGMVERRLDMKRDEDTYQIRIFGAPLYLPIRSVSLIGAARDFWAIHEDKQPEGTLLEIKGEEKLWKVVGKLGVDLRFHCVDRPSQ